MRWRLIRPHEWILELVEDDRYLCLGIVKMFTVSRGKAWVWKACLNGREKTGRAEDWTDAINFTEFALADLSHA
jgi:hypothetical protein